MKNLIMKVTTMVLLWFFLASGYVEAGVIEPVASGKHQDARENGPARRLMHKSGSGAAHLRSRIFLGNGSGSHHGESESTKHKSQDHRDEDEEAFISGDAGLEHINPGEIAWIDLAPMINHSYFTLICCRTSR